MKQAFVRVALLGIGLALGWCWPKGQAPAKKESASIANPQSILGPIKIRSGGPKNEKATSLIAPIPLEHELTTISGLIQYLDEMRALDEEDLLQQLKQWQQRREEGRSISGILCLAYAAALLADSHTESLKRALAEELKGDDDVLGDLFFERWIPEDHELEGLKEWSGNILLGMAKRDPERAWRQVLTMENITNEVWWELASRWHSQGSDFLKTKLAELSSEDQKQGLLANWGLAESQKSPSRAIALLEELEMTDDARQEYIENVISTWARKDLPAALDYVNGLEKEQAEALISGKLSSWAEIDLLATADWATSHLSGAMLDHSLGELVPMLAKSNLDHAKDLLAKISAPETAFEAAESMTIALREIDPIAAYEFQASTHFTELSAQRTDIGSIARAVVNADVDYAYVAMLDSTTFSEERAWADALAFHIADLPHNTAQTWLQNVPDDTWRRRLSWMVADRNAPY